MNDKLEMISKEIRELNIEIQGLEDGCYKRDRIRHLRKMLRQKYKLLKEDRKTVTGGTRK